MATGRAIDIDPTFVAGHFYHSYGLLLAGRRREAAAEFELLAREYSVDPVARLALRLWNALTGERTMSPLSGIDRSTAEADESCAYFVAASYAVAGDREQALEWLEFTIKVCGWVDYGFFSQHEPFLRSLALEPRYQELMSYMKQEYDRFDA